MVWSSPRVPDPMISVSLCRGRAVIFPVSAFPLPACGRRELRNPSRPQISTGYLSLGRLRDAGLILIGFPCSRAFSRWPSTPSRGEEGSAFGFTGLGIVLIAGPPAACLGPSASRGRLARARHTASSDGTPCRVHVWPPACLGDCTVGGRRRGAALLPGEPGAGGGRPGRSGAF